MAWIVFVSKVIIKAIKENLHVWSEEFEACDKLISGGWKAGKCCSGISFYTLLHKERLSLWDCTYQSPPPRWWMPFKVYCCISSQIRKLLPSGGAHLSSTVQSDLLELKLKVNSQLAADFKLGQTDRLVRLGSFWLPEKSCTAYNIRFWHISDL